MQVSQRTLVFIVERPVGRVLLGYKKTGFGKGKLLGIGGKVEEGESVAEAAIREVKEEVGISIGAGDLIDCGKVEFQFPSKPAWDQDALLFRCETWQGAPAETSEIRPEWFKLDQIPFDKMWDDAKYWVPKLLENAKINIKVIFNDDLETVRSVDWHSA
jgi:8-oxo-dGTP diphosphatase